MKHFLIEITYTAAAEKLAEVRPLHRDYVKGEFEKGWLLLAAQRSTKEGSIIIARAETQEIVEAFTAKDPFRVNKLADYRISEIDPVFRNDVLSEWVGN